MSDDSSSSSSASDHIDEAEPLLRRPSAFYSKYEATGAAKSTPPNGGESSLPTPPPPPPLRPLRPRPPPPDPTSLSIHPQGEILRSVEYDTFPEDVTFGRNISWLSAYMLIISRMIGSGIFATPGVIFKSVGSVGLSLLLWIVGAAISACGLSISLELGCMLPRSGGTKVYLEYIYRRPRFLASTLYAVNAVLLGFTASNAIVFSRYILFAFYADHQQDLGGGLGFAQKTIAVLMLTLITIIHGCFLKTGILIQNSLGWAKILVVLIMLFASLVAFLRRAGLSGSGSGSGSGSDSGSAPTTVNFLSWEELWQGSNWRWGVVSTAIFKVSYSYAGYDNVNNVMNEVKNPIKTLKSAAPAALLTICIFYLLLNLAYFSVLPVEDVRSSGELIAALFFQKLFGRGPAQTILPLLIAISAFGNVMVVTFALVRRLLLLLRSFFLFPSSFPSSSPSSFSFSFFFFFSQGPHFATAHSATAHSRPQLHPKLSNHREICLSYTTNRPA